jgi:hypothetical protein
LNGSDPTVVECTQSATYTDAGATANDNRDGDLTAGIIVSGLPINAHTPGSHTVTYSVTDVAGNTGQATRTVNVVDTTNPAVTLNGTASVTVECHGTYTESGASAVDACDTAVSTAVVSGSVDVNTPGVYTLTYSAMDASNHTGSQIRTVTVSDTTPPAITLNGGAMNVSCGATYADPGATATDACDNNLPAITVGGLAAINTAIPGDYTLTYDVADASSNNALQVTRTVTVLNNCGSVVIDGPQEAIVGDYVTLTALHGLFVGNVNYNWTKDGQGVPGANSRRLVFEEIQLGDAPKRCIQYAAEPIALPCNPTGFVLAPGRACRRARERLSRRSHRVSRRVGIRAAEVGHHHRERCAD